MKQATENQILSAQNPSDIFTLDPDIIEQEKEKYLDRFRPKAYKTIENFVLTQKITLLYRKAISEMNCIGTPALDNFVLNIDGQTYTYHYSYDIKIGHLYVTEDLIIYVIDPKYKNYYINYQNKVQNLTKLDNKVWEIIQYMIPNIYKQFIDITGNHIIMLKKPCSTIYPLREVLNYFGQSIRPEYVASILSRLYYFECYLELLGVTNNGLTIDSLFFAPGREVEEGKPYTIDDVRIVGVLGGWFFSTWSDEKISGMPKEIYDIIPINCKKRGFSSFEVDLLSIQKIGNELIGNENLSEVPTPLKNWLTKTSFQRNAYEELKSWEDILTQSFGKRKFIEMNINI